MKNQLDFNIPFSSSGTHGDMDFITCFTSAVVFLETGGKLDGEGAPCKHHKVCIGCSVHCNDSPASKLARWFYLFQAMSGASCIRRRYDGKPSEMQRLIGDCDGLGIGNDDTADFMFGFAGYDFRKLTDPAGFKAAIIASIDAGKPVLAKVKTNFRVLTGYNGDTLVSPDHVNTFSKAKVKGVSEYGEIEWLYIFGEKITPRYTLRDGLERIKHMFELNEKEKIWDDYSAQMHKDFFDRKDEEYTALSPNDRRACMKNLKAAALIEWCTHGLGQAFAGRQHEEIRNPALFEIWGKLDKLTGRMNCIGHAVYHLDSKLNYSEINHHADRVGIGDVLRFGIIERYKAGDAELLDLIKQAIGILNKSQ
ncbi:MAG: hypothetical protein FWD53_11540 [Phycisphaerales bacterium]|nr:hypothetical protein [Phycisphaerales bacterium]